MNEKEFKQNVFPLKDRVFRLSLSILGDVAEAEDATQDVFMKLWHMRKDLKKYNSIDAMALTMVKNKSLDILKRHRIRRDKTPEVGQQLEVLNNTPNDNKEMVSLIKKAIDKLPLNQRIIIHMRDVEGHSFEEIEKVVGMKKETIRVNLSRARKQVREQLNKVVNYGL